MGAFGNLGEFTNEELKQEFEKAVNSSEIKIEKEEEVRKKILAKRKGHYIRIRGWTEETGSASEEHATSVTDAIKRLRKVARHHPNFTVESRCESPFPDNYLEWSEWLRERQKGIKS